MVRSRVGPTELLTPDEKSEGDPNRTCDHQAADDEDDESQHRRRVALSVVCQVGAGHDDTGASNAERAFHHVLRLSRRSSRTTTRCLETAGAGLLTRPAEHVEEEHLGRQRSLCGGGSSRYGDCIATSGVGKSMGNKRSSAERTTGAAELSKGMLEIIGAYGTQSGADVRGADLKSSSRSQSPSPQRMLACADRDTSEGIRPRARAG